jgi:hypothetical protein
LLTGGGLAALGLAALAYAWRGRPPHWFRP